MLRTDEGGNRLLNVLTIGLCLCIVIGLYIQTDKARQSAACLYRHASFFVLAKWRTVLSPGTGGQPPDPTGSNCDANAEAGRINSRQNQQSASAMAENTGESGWKKARARADVLATSAYLCRRRMEHWAGKDAAGRARTAREWPSAGRCTAPSRTN